MPSTLSAGANILNANSDCLGSYRNGSGYTKTRARSISFSIVGIREGRDLEMIISPKNPMNKCVFLSSGG